MADEDLLSQLKTTSKEKAAQEEAKHNPPSQDHIEGLKRFDNYSIWKHFTSIQILYLYFFALVAAIFLLIQVCWIVWMIYLYFDGIAEKPEEVIGFLKSAANLILTILSTLFLNYVLTKKK